jgi:DNA polymerase III subunit delta
MELEYAGIAAKGFPQPLARVYLLAGSDDALKREALAALTASLVDPNFADFDREERDVPSSGAGTEGTFAMQLLSAAATIPFSSPRRVVVATNAQRLSKEDQDALAAGLSSLGDFACLILIAGAPEYDAGKVKARSTVGTKLVNAIAKVGTVVRCDAPTPGDLRSRAMTIVKARGKMIEPAALDVIIARSVAAASERGGGGKAGDLNVLINELEKALSYIGDRPKITPRDAAVIGTRGAEENIFALLDAVGRRDVGRALSELEEMFRSGDKPDAIAARTFVMLARHLRLVWGAKFLAEQRITGNTKAALPPDVQEALSGEIVGLAVRQSYLLRGLQEQARGWTYARLRDALARVLISDLSLKGIPTIKHLHMAKTTSEDAGANLRLLVVELCHI